MDSPRQWGGTMARRRERSPGGLDGHRAGRGLVVRRLVHGRRGLALAASGRPAPRASEAPRIGTAAVREQSSRTAGWPAAPFAGPASLSPPVLILWVDDDRFLERHVAQAGLALCDDGRLEVVEGASHWLHLEQPARINRRVAAFLGGR